MPVTTASAEERMQAVELLLLWEGQVRNARLRELFPIHATQASRDIAAYREQAPDNCARVEGTKDYAPTVMARPVLTNGRFADYARLVGALGLEGPLHTAVTAEHVFVDHTEIRATVFRVLHRAMTTGGGATIEYASMSNPTPHERTIFPHALIHAGPRWHLRAWCAMKGDFRDFNLGRITAADPAGTQAQASATDDAAWMTIIDVRLEPHQALNAKQAKLIRAEYMGGTTALVLRRRAAVIPYLLHAYRAALDPDLQAPPDYVLQVRDPKELPEAARWRL